MSRIYFILLEEMPFALGCHIYNSRYYLQIPQKVKLPSEAWVQRHAGVEAKVQIKTCLSTYTRWVTNGFSFYLYTSWDTKYMCDALHNRHISRPSLSVSSLRVKESRSLKKSRESHGRGVISSLCTNVSRFSCSITWIHMHQAPSSRVLCIHASHGNTNLKGNRRPLVETTKLKLSDLDCSVLWNAKVGTVKHLIVIARDNCCASQTPDPREPTRQLRKSENMRLAPCWIDQITSATTSSNNISVRRRFKRHAEFGFIYRCYCRNILAYTWGPRSKKR